MKPCPFCGDDVFMIESIVYQKWDSNEKIWKTVEGVIEQRIECFNQECGVRPRLTRITGDAEEIWDKRGGDNRMDEERINALSERLERTRKELAETLKEIDEAKKDRITVIGDTTLSFIFNGQRGKIEIRKDGKYKGISFYLSDFFNWEILKDDSWTSCLLLSVP